MGESGLRVKGRSRFVRGACVALAAFAFARAGLAQTHRDLATRRLLIEQATAERAAGHHAQALSLAQRAGAVQMSPSVQLFIAQEMDATGDPAGALALADQCARDVERDPAIPHGRELLTTCRDLARETRARVGYLVVSAPDPSPEGLRVSVQGAPLNPALLGVPNVVSPGSVAVEATAPGRRDFSASRSVAAGATERVTLDLPPVVVEAPVVVAPPVVVVAPPVVVVARPVVVVPHRTARSRAVPWALVGGGAAALVGGAVLLAVRAAALDGCVVSGSAAECDSQTDVDDARSANGLAAGAGVALGVGAAAVAVGVGWLLLGGSAPARVTASVTPSRDGVTFGLGGRWP